MVTLYNVISSDGFIARKDGSEDFIPDSVWQDFLDVCHVYDAVVMGRKTYEAIQKYDATLISEFEHMEIEKIVISQNEKFVPKEGYIKVSSPEESVSPNFYTLLTSGPSLNTAFLQKKLIDKIILNKLPDAIDSGLRQFEEGSEPTLILENEIQGERGNKISTYKLSSSNINEA